MKGKEALFGVFCGVVGAVLVMAAGSFSPLGAQNEVADAEFGTIACSKLVVGDDGFGGATEIVPFGVRVSGKDGRSAWLDALGVGVVGEEGKGRVYVTAEDGGAVHVFGGKDGGGSVLMKIDENGGAVAVFGKDGGGAARMAINEDGGLVTVLGRGNTDLRALMGVNKYGNGVVFTWDKNGYRRASLK